MMPTGTALNEVLKDFSLLPLSDKEYVVEIMEKQLVEAKRESIAKRAKKAVRNLKKGVTKKGTIEDIYRDIELD